MGMCDLNQACSMGYPASIIVWFESAVVNLVFFLFFFLCLLFKLCVICHISFYFCFMFLFLWQWNDISCMYVWPRWQIKNNNDNIKIHISGISTWMASDGTTITTLGFCKISCYPGQFQSVGATVCLSKTMHHHILHVGLLFFLKRGITRWWTSLPDRNPTEIVWNQMPVWIRDTDHTPSNVAELRQDVGAWCMPHSSRGVTRDTVGSEPHNQ